MRFIVDAQLPPALARWLTAQGHHAEHVADLSMEAAADAAIWRWAELNGATIVTKDEDFAIWRNSRSGNTPAVVWLRIGNTRRRELLRWFETLLPKVIKALDQGEMLVEVR